MLYDKKMTSLKDKITEEAKDKEDKKKVASKSTNKDKKKKYEKSKK
jgi:hypothetical protein